MVPGLATPAIALFMMVTIAGAQSASTSKAQEKKERDDRVQKALAVVEQIRNDAQSLKLPENRIRIDIDLAQLLWPRDEKKARSLVKEAVRNLAELTAAADGGDKQVAGYFNGPYQMLLSQLRQNILEVTAAHDPGLALDLLRATRPASASRTPGVEAQLEMRLAAQVADKDPARALAAGEESLSLAVDYEALNLLYRLQSADKGAAERFLQGLLSRLRADDLSRATASSGVAVTLLRSWIEGNRPATGEPAQRTTIEITVPGFNEQAARELSSLILRQVLADPAQVYPGQTYAILSQLKPLLGDVERLAPGEVGALKQRIAEYDTISAAQRGIFSKYDELFRNGTVEALLEAAKTAAPETASGLIQTAARKAINEMDGESARQIIGKIADPGERSEMTAALDRQLFYRANQDGKIGDARAAISRLPSPEERAILLAQLAGSVESGGDKSTALQLLSEAEDLVAGRAESYSQLGAQVRVARAHERLDVTRSTSIIEGVIARVDELADAALALSGFDLQVQYFRWGEFVINRSTPLGNIIQESAGLLGSIARSDFDRSKLAADRFERPEMRMMALIEIARQVLADEGR